MTNQNIVLPAIALRGTTILPGMIVHFDVSRERSVKAIEAAMLHDQKIFLVTQIDPEVESPDLAGVYHVGTIAYIKQVVKLPQNLLRVLVEGTGRATLVKFEQEFPFIRSEITPVDEEEMQMPEPVMEAMHRSLKELFHRYCMENGKVSKELVAQILNIDNVEELVEQIAVNIPLSYQNKQKILEALTLEERYEVLGAILGNEIEIMQIGRDLQKKVKARIDKNQREYILREQLKLIREELGEDNTADDAEEFKKKLQELQAGDEVKEKISKEIERFKNTNSNVSENAVLRGYIETMLALPWEKKSTDSDDLKEAWKVLQEGHYGLKDVKERVMEFLSVRKLTHKGKSPILCLVGPPGTGKTSIARSIAEAMHKKYVRICLGGVSTIGQNDSFCKKCGIELTADNKEIIIKKANRRISVGIYALLGIIIISGVTGVFLYSRNGSLLYDLSGSTGVYAQKYDNTISDADYWIVDCKALSDGVFKKSVRNEKLENLIVEGRTTDGEMILTVEAGNCKKEYNITNTEGEMVFDVSEFEPGLLKLYISHPKSEHIFVCIKWK